MDTNACTPLSELSVLFLEEHELSGVDLFIHDHLWRSEDVYSEPAAILGVLLDDFNR